MMPVKRVLTTGLLLTGLAMNSAAGAGEAAAELVTDHPLATDGAACAPCVNEVQAVTTSAGFAHPLADLGRVERFPLLASLQQPGIGIPTDAIPPLSLPPQGGPQAYWRAPTPGVAIAPPPIPVMPKVPGLTPRWWDCCLGRDIDRDACDHDYDEDCHCLHCRTIFKDLAHHGAVGVHHGRAWRYVSGQHHGFPFTHSHYLPRAAGATYNFGRWVPTRSFYYPYVPGSQATLPYGFSPEPYYFPEAFYMTGMN